MLRCCLLLQNVAWVCLCVCQVLPWEGAILGVALECVSSKRWQQHGAADFTPWTADHGESESSECTHPPWGWQVWGWCCLSSKFFDHLLLLLVRFLILCEWFNIMQMIGIVLTSAERAVWSATHAELLSLTWTPSCPSSAAARAAPSP